MTATPSLFDALRWTDRYRVGQRVHDGIRPATVTAVLTDRPGCVDHAALELTYDDGHCCTFGTDNTFSDRPLLDGSDAATAAERPAVAAISSAPHPACAANEGGGSPVPRVRAVATQPPDGSAPIADRTPAGGPVGIDRTHEEAPAQRDLPGA